MKIKLELETSEKYALADVVNIVENALINNNLTVTITQFGDKDGHALATLNHTISEHIYEVHNDK